MGYEKIPMGLIEMDMTRIEVFPQPGLPWGSYSPERNQSALVGGTGSPNTGNWFPDVSKVLENRLKCMEVFKSVYELV